MALPPRPSLVDSALGPGDVDPALGTMEVPVDEPQELPEGVEMIEEPDGSVTFMDPDELEAAQMAALMAMLPHDANIAHVLDDTTMNTISAELRADIEEDIESRSSWLERYREGLELLGTEYEDRDTPFEGASGVSHPLIAEGVTQFQAQAYKELLPAGGPVKTKIVGTETKEIEEQSVRVAEHMNYVVMDVMEEYDEDMDQLLFMLPLSGSCFKKVYRDNALNRPVSEFVPGEDLIVPYSAASLDKTPRATHRLRMTWNDIRRDQVSGFYRDVEISNAGTYDVDDVKEEKDEIEGISRTYTDDVYTVYECHTELDLPGFEHIGANGEPTGLKLPYIVTLIKDTGTVLSIRRNFAENDPLFKKTQFFVHYKFMPGLGFYGFGLIHMIGGLGQAATSLLRQLIDAGTLSNLPGGFKARGVRLKNTDEPIQPGEWRDIDAPGGNVRDALIPLPYKEPSATLATLLGALVDAGRRFVSIADQQMSNMPSEMPVGTMVAMLERGMKVMSAIHKRLHNAQKKEFKILARIIGDDVAAGYPYQVDGGQPNIMQTDFDGRVDVIPVSDPNIFSMAQRVTLAQTQLQMAQAAPELHNLHAAYRRMYHALEVQNIDELLPPVPQPQPKPPALENADFARGKPSPVFPDQNHEAHIEGHITFANTQLVQMNPQLQGLMFAHVQEHVHHLAVSQVMQEIEQAIGQVQQGMATGEIDPTIGRNQIAATQQITQDQKMIAEYVSPLEAELLADVMARMTPQPPNPEDDPLVKIRNKELDIKELKTVADIQTDQDKLAMEDRKLEQKAAGESARLDLQEQIADDRNEVNIMRIEEQSKMAQQRQGGKE